MPRAKPKSSTIGRPTIFTEELAEWICDIVATHPVGYRTIEKLYPQMPDYTTLLDWRRKNSSFSQQYLEAKRFQAEIMVEEIDDLIPHAILYYNDDKGQERIDSPSAALAIAKINNRKWIASKLAPKIYGDQKQIDDLTAENNRMKEELAELKKVQAELNEKYKKEY